MKIKLRTELCRAVIRAGKTLPAALMGYDDNQAFMWFKSYHPVIYNRTLGLRPKLEIVK